MEHTRIPEKEIELFKQLKDLKVIFDVGARTDTDYSEIWPESEHHLFEPHPEFFLELMKKTWGRRKVFPNNFGLGEKNENLGYQTDIQAFIGSAGLSEKAVFNYILPVKTLDDYVKDNKITQIDFLKIDTEGHDLKVIIGAKNSLEIIRFIQYEHWGHDNDSQIHHRLQDNFDLEYVGYRNTFCMNKKLVSEEERARLKAYIVENKLAELA